MKSRKLRLLFFAALSCLIITSICTAASMSTNKTTLSDAELAKVFGGGACQKCDWIEGTDGCFTPNGPGCYIYDPEGSAWCMGYVIGGICSEESKKCNGKSNWYCNPSNPECSREYSITSCRYQGDPPQCKEYPLGTQYYECGGTKDWCHLSPTAP
jgi:hypothetical protein